MLKLATCIMAGAIVFEPSLLNLEGLMAYKDVLIAFGLAGITYPWFAHQFE